jgi:uncharacterized protein (TIGR02246 family)
MMNHHGQWNRGRLTALVVTLMMVAAGVFWCLASGGRAGADEEVGLKPRAVNAAQADDEKAIRKAAETFVKAFNAGDAKALAALWAPDGDFMDVRGQVFRGRETIEKMFAAHFATARGSKIEVTIDSIRFLGKDTAIEKGTSQARPAAGGAVTAGRFTAVRVKRDGKWLLESVHESPYEVESNYENLKDLEWVIGTWTASPPGATVERTCEWVGNRNFILCRQEMRKGDSVVGTSTQVIGWDPIERRVRSWDFDSEGGFGSELWTKDGGRWVLEATGVRRDATVTEATNIITPVDANTFTWQSIHRRSKDAPLPDTGVVKAVRMPVKK